LILSMQFLIPSEAPSLPNFQAAISGKFYVQLGGAGTITSTSIHS
jgi:hypothetical protein